MLLQWHYFVLSYSWVILHRIYVPHLYPPLCWWTFRLFPCLGYCKYCWSEHRGACIFWIMIFFGYMPRCKIAGSHGSSIFRFLRKHHTVFCSGCSNLHSHQQCGRVSFSLHCLQHLLLVDFWWWPLWLIGVILHCSFDRISVKISSVEHFFTYLLAIRMYHLEK